MTTAIDVRHAHTSLYPAPERLARTANVTADDVARADADPVAFWEQAARRLDWQTPWHTAHSWEPVRQLDDGSLTVPRTEWFAGGTLNAAVNCVDRHVAAGRGDTVALHFEGEAGDRRTLTYADLQREVSRAANALLALGVGQGDRVIIYLPVIPETLIATLAVARIGAIHSLVFGGFSAEAVAFRINDTGAKLLITSDGQFRRGRAVPVKSGADAAVAVSPTIEHVLVVRRTGDQTPDEVPWTPGRDVWWHDAVAAASDTHEPDFFDAETPLFIMYTSGTTGKPKGLVHTTGGYLVQASYTHWAIFDAQPDDVYWCTADLAWVTAHTYAIYGPLSNGVTQVMYEGTPDTPHPGRHFEIIERYGVTTYYTAPTLIRTLRGRFPDGPPASYDLSRLRLLGTVGEGINPSTWRWFHERIGRGACPIIDTWWQSETGAAIIAPLPGVTTLKPGSATRVLPGVSTRVVDAAGDDVAPGIGGNLVVEATGPALARTVWGDPERYRDSYWAAYWRQGWFLSGDGATEDADGDTWVLGRIDDVINVSGHRLSALEIESALVSHPDVVEAGVAGVQDAVTGSAVAAFVVTNGVPASSELTDALRAHTATQIGPIAKPAHVIVVRDLPKTRSGKILRRLLGQIVDGQPLGDTTSLHDDTIPDELANAARQQVVQTSRE
ncbi:acetate--CoA ligase [Microbacterium sp. MPKO10]|uniref:acetate--CoA ligase n=1 Tax=Microbacterium sp. MPKO10 TaxID=2989818 RepID=UPI00223580E1|nr:acetate--CoA ligase [Microbacterium sp. MPKO10]MCW4459030.1 acetate--CoA ligase [Microbacterium sp. MPKO10]